MTNNNGNCFSDAGLFVTFNREWTLVHGVPTLQVAPYKRYGHAWAEKDGIVIDFNKMTTLPACIYYIIGKINKEECKKYSFTEMRRMIFEHGHWGPWELPDNIL